MSFLDLLGTVEGAKAPTAIPGNSRDAQAAARRSNIAKKEGLVAKEQQPRDVTAKSVQANGHSQLKRKADGEDINQMRPKAPRTSTADNATSRSTTAASTANAQPYRGTAGLERPRAIPKSVQAVARPGSITASPAIVQSAPKQAPARPQPPTTAQPGTASKPPPKKGSYAEILARAANTQTTYTGIKHKTMDEIKKAKPVPIVKEKGKLGSRAKANIRRPGSAEVQSGSEKDRPGPDKARKPAGSGYQGTARAAPAASARPAYQGTMRKGIPNGKRSDLERRGTGNQTDRAVASKRYTYYEDEDDDEEEEDDYDSDGSSDMEANMFEVDQEEELALRAAKREDAEEQAKLADLEREKKRRKQLALAQSLKERKERRRFM